MEEQQNPAGEQPSQALTPPEGQSVEVMQQQINPDASVANTAVQPPPSIGPRKRPNRFNICMKSFMKSFMIGLRKLWILLWKNMLLRGRSWILLIFQILMIGIVLALAIVMGAPYSSKELKPPTEAKTYHTDDLIDKFAHKFSHKEILYVPDTTEVRDIIAEIEAKISSYQSLSFTRRTWNPSTIDGVETRANEAFTDSNINFRGAIIFEKVDSNGVNYKIRVTSGEGIGSQSSFSQYGGPSNRILELDEAHFRTETLHSSGDSLGSGPQLGYMHDYSKAGILGLQFLIDDAALKVLRPNEAPNGLKREITLKSFPYPEYYAQYGNRVGEQGGMFCGLFILVFLFSNAFLAMNIGGEKDTGVKELLKLCGYPGWMQWLAWYLIMFLVDLILLTFLAVVIKYVRRGSEAWDAPFLENTDASLVLFLLLLTMIANNASVIFICSLIKSTSIATAVALLIPLPIVLITLLVVPKRFSPLMAISLLPQGCFFVAFIFVTEFESEKIGAHWSMLDKSLPNIPTLNLGYVILMFLVDIVLYQSLAVYFESIIPSDYGVRKSPLYPIKAIIRTIKALVLAIKARRRGNHTAPNPSQMTVPPTESKAGGFEPPPGPEKLVGVEIRNLVKKFDRNKIAVNGVSLKMYDGEIFALLGHNGAGKTTLISMLTGLFAPTSGTAIVYGNDISRDLDKVRQSLGLCPQHDMLFKNLTVMEHLKIFGQMKGQSSSQVRQEALGLLTMMNLAEKKNTVSKKLSGGQKRKLCLGMALIGGAKVVVLDEPTSGMDPEARRAIWDILLQVRGQRTILLTTHFMEEADVLGDRIGIMAAGQMQCCGSPSFLKSFYGTGYTLKMALLPGADKYAILTLVQKHVSNAILKPINMPTEAFISLPTDTAGSSALSSLFSTLTEKKEELRIESLGLSVASMDEIFVKVGELSEMAAAEAHHAQATNSPKSKSSVRTRDQEMQKEVHVDPPQASQEPDPLESSPISEAPTASHIEGQVQPVGNAERKTVPPSAASSKSIRKGGKSKIFRCGIGKFCLTVLLQMLTLIIKRFIITKRKIWAFLFQILFPVLMMLGAVLVINDEINPEKLPPPRAMSLKDYKNSRTLYSNTQGSIPNNKIVRAIKDSEAVKVTNIEDELKKVAKSDIYFFREHLIAAGEIVSDIEYNAWFNTIPLHAAPLALNLASNIHGQELSRPFTIQMTNHPLVTLAAAKMQATLELGTYRRGFGAIIYFMLTALLLFPLFFVVLPTEERLNMSRQLQLMTGIHPMTYWGTYFLWDFIILLLVSTFMVLVVVILEDYSILSSHGGLRAIFLVVLGYGLVVIPLAYLISSLPKTVTGGVIILLLFLLVPVIIGLIMAIIAVTAKVGIFMANIASWGGVLLSFINMKDDLKVNSKCNLLGKDELDIICKESTNKDDLKKLQACCGNCSTLGATCFEPKPYLRWIAQDNGGNGLDIPGNGQLLLGLLVMSLIYMTLHILSELGIMRLIRSLLTRGVSESDFLNQVDDGDVRMEEYRVAEMIATKNTGADALVVQTLCKNFGGLSAVSKLTFGVHHGECFGLLGTNGAGKTTSFRMITGEELPSFGDVHESRFTLKRNRRSLISHIGYCPQFDAFVPYFTGKENLQLMGRLRGIPWRQVNTEAAKLLQNVGLTESGNVQCRKYSGGMKRRLSAAIAIIGNPALILLDEPTSGVDPVSRRQFWKVLERVKGHGQSIILTSHSMDECEALCARLGIMVNGQLQCIGGVQHLKHKYAQGYSLTLRLKSITDPQQQQYAMGMLGALNNEISEKFHPCMLKDQHETVLQYQIENTTLGWNVIYNNLEELKKSYGDIIEDYSVSETSLEEVFLSFSRKQYPPRDSKIPLCRRIWTCQY